MRHVERRHVSFPPKFFSQNRTPVCLPCFNCMQKFDGPRYLIPDKVTEHGKFVFKPPPHCEVYCAPACTLAAAKTEQVALVHMMFRVMYKIATPVSPAMDRRLLIYGIVTPQQFKDDVFRNQHGMVPRLLPDQIREYVEVNPHVLANHILDYAKGDLPVENMPHLKAFVESCNERAEEERKKERARFKAEAERKAQVPVDDDAKMNDEDEDDDPPEADMVDLVADVAADGFEDAFEEEDDEDD